MNESLQIVVGRRGRDNKRHVSVVGSGREHRDVFEVDVAFTRRKWRDNVVEYFALGDDAHSWLEGELLREADKVDDEQPHGRAVVKPMADFSEARTDWLWTGYFPAGAISLLEGDPGLGKSQATCWLSAAVSTGGPMPDGSTNPLGGPRGVLLLSAEDDPARTIQPRLRAVGADLNRVHLFAGVECFDGAERGFSLPMDSESLEVAIRDFDVAFCVIDPLPAYFDSNINMNADSDVRRALKPLAEIGERTGVCFLVLRHLNKKAGTPSMYRGGGSVGIIGAARAAFVVAKSEDDPELRILAPVKMNLAKMPPAISFTVEQHETTSRIVWGTESDITADELLSGGEKKGSGQFETAKRIIAELLAGGPRGSNEVEQACEAEGVSNSTYWRARRALKLHAEKTEFGGGQWLLSLPANDDPKPFDEFL